MQEYWPKLALAQMVGAWVKEMRRAVMVRDSMLRRLGMVWSVYWCMMPLYGYYSEIAR